MWKALVLFAVTLPTFADADVWRWRDANGQVHYSNVPGNVPKHASPVRADVGYLAAAATHEPVAVEEVQTSETELRRSERRLRRRLAEIEAFYRQVRDRQRARLQSYATSTLLPDWLVADRWMAAKDEETRLRATLAQLERRRSGLL
jgi:hypothetical protein